MEQIIRILMRRDGYTRDEAREIVEETLAEVHEAIGLGDYTLAEDIFTGDLGLEIDYLLETLTI